MRTAPAKAAPSAGRAVAKPATKKPAAPAAEAPTAKPAAAKATAVARKPAPVKASPTPAAVKSPTAPKARLAPAQAAPASAVAAPATPTEKPRLQPKGDSFKMRMLVDQVVKATGSRKKGVKDVVEATLSRIGEALARGDELNLPGFGKVRVVKTDARDGTAVMTLKLRQGGAKPGQKGLAATGDDD